MLRSATQPVVLMSCLGYLGLLPFFAFAVLVWSDDLRWIQLGTQGFLLYAAMILAFLGGTLWGSARGLDLALRSPRLLLSNGVVIFAVAALLFTPPAIAAGLILLGHVSLLLFELRAPISRGWYLRLRIKLTTVSALSYPLFVTGLMLH